VTAPARDRDVVTWLGLAVVGAAAAVLSFSALSDLARLCGITGTVAVNGRTFHLAWLLPITVDVLAAVATRIWLRRRAAPEAVVFAQRAAWAAIAGTVVGNAYHGVLIRSTAEPPLLAAVAVSAVPAVALGALVHLAVLVGREPGGAGASRASDPGRMVRVRAAVVARWITWRAEHAAGRKPKPTAGDAGRDTGGPVVPTGADSNDELAADLRRLNAARRAEGMEPLSRDAVRERYGGIGSTRAQTVREMAARPEPPVKPRLIRGEEEAAG
jgi:hypothetical protein